MDINSYIKQLNTRFKSGISKEHAYRIDLENLIRELVTGVEITNEPANVTDCGNPDYVITRKRIPIGYIEAKDIGKDLNNKLYREQFTRYKKALDNLIITDYLWFQFFQHGQLVHEIRIGEIEGNKILPLTSNFDQFTRLVKDFCSFIGQTIKSSKKLAEMMAAKAKLLENILERAVTSDEVTQDNTSLKGQYDSFKHVLIHDLTPKGFSDIYAQTLAYGMFAARLHDPSLNDFSRQEAAELIPKTNPFLRKLFQYVAGYDIDERIKTTVDNLAEVFRATDVKALLKNFGKSTQAQDPIIHFYETFLSEYDPKLRKSRGVWYTPEPVVNFIVRAVDDILKTEFNLPQGLADTSKTKIKIKTQTRDKRTESGYKEIEQEVHKVQILDPATGTGTFLAEVVKHIYNSRFKHMQGIWGSYVENDLIPRLNGFELLMASYTMAHLKLDMLLSETGYKPQKDQRFNIYLTNSLEEHHPDTGTLFAQWLSSEANEANHIKRDTPVMVIMGNPPYSVSSTNKSKWIENLMQDYKKDLNEGNIQPLSDDYIKFIRYGQHFIEKNGEGILAYISNNSFIDGINHRQMRKCLLQNFDKLYIIDLHGDSKKKEKSPDGGIDQNVFDIMQGVAISIFVKTKAKTKNKDCFVYHFDLYGRRDYKYNFFKKYSLEKITWKEPIPEKPYFFFVKKNINDYHNYVSGIQLNELWINKKPGVETGKDDFFISESEMDLVKRFEDIDDETLIKYQIKNKSGFNLLTKLKKNTYSQKHIRLYLSKPFDYKYCYYQPSILRRASLEIQKEIIDKKNVALICKRGRLLGGNYMYTHISITNILTDKNFLADQSYILPLYIYPESLDKNLYLHKRIPNLNSEILTQITNNLNLTFVPEKEPEGNVCYVNNPEVRNDYKTTFAPHRHPGLHLRSTSFSSIPREVQRVSEN